jgi:outer membrane protein assembly factor BamB
MACKNITKKYELERLLDDIRLICTTPKGFDIKKYEYYKEKLLKQYTDEDLIDIEEVDNVEPTVKYKQQVTSLLKSGPMDSPWPMQSHDVYHTGLSPYSTADNPGIEKWRFYFDGWMDNGMVIDNDGVVYAGVGNRYIYAIYPDGAEKWKYKTNGLIFGSTPAIAEDGTIYIGSWDCHLHAINPDGTRKWTFLANAANIASSPAIAEDGTIYFGTLWSLGDGGKIHAVSPNGTEKWHYQTGYGIISDPAIGEDGTVYIGSGDAYLYAMGPNGTLRWRFLTGNEIHGHPAIGDDGTIYIGSWDDQLYAINPDGTEKWRISTQWGTSNSVAIGEDGTIYVGTDKLYAINPDGTRKWTFNLGDESWVGKSSPAISADGTIYIATEIGDRDGGELITINSDGTEKWRKLISDYWSDSSPAIAEDGTVYIGSAFQHKGYLHAFGPIDSNTPPDAPIITGPTHVRPREENRFYFKAVDPDNNPVSLYIDWGDGKTEGWTWEQASNERVRFSHTFKNQGTFTISAKAKDVMGEESSWGYLEVTVPKNKVINFNLNLLERLLEQFPVLSRIYYLIK